MSTVIDLGRSIQAVCAPVTGERASGYVTLKASSAEGVKVTANEYLFPIVNGQVRYDMNFKTVKNPLSEDGEWTVPGGGTLALPVISNIGGKRHNLKPGTKFVLDDLWLGALERQAVTKTGFSGGADPTGYVSLYNFVIFENFGAKPSVELFKSAIGGRFPAAVMHWMASEPADGMSTSATNRPTHRGQGRITFTELFKILVVSTREDSEHNRRAQPLRVVQELSELLFDRQSVDDHAFSSPGGVHIRGRGREGSGEDGFYRTFQVYSLTISAQATITQKDSRVYHELKRFRIDAPREATPENLPVVVNNLVDNPQDP